MEAVTASLRSVDPNAYNRNRVRQIAYGRWQPYVDAEPARQHVQALQANGIASRLHRARRGPLRHLKETS